jgi:hypothetical protein
MYLEGEARKVYLVLNPAFEGSGRVKIDPHPCPAEEVKEGGG